MTDHDQTELELMYERRKTDHVWRIVIALAIMLAFTAAHGAWHSYQLGLDIAALTAKCGPEAR